MNKPSQFIVSRYAAGIMLLMQLMVMLAITLPPVTFSQTTVRLATFPSPEVEFVVGPLTVNDNTTFFDTNQITRGLVHGANFPVNPPAFPAGDYATDTEAQNAFQNANYYDLALTMYGAYYRTGDVRFRDYARKIADAWWRSAGIAEGKVTDLGTYSYAPRGISLNGLILRALDGRPDMWPWITFYTREQFNTWVGARVTYDGLYYGARDGGYMLLYAANLARVHPDPIVRQEFYDKSLSAAVNYYARLQFPDGSFRWDDGEGGIYWQGKATQPFHVGLLLEGMVAVHRLTNNETVKASILKACESLMRSDNYNRNGWRSFWYLTNTPIPPVSDPWPVTSGDLNIVREARSLNSTSIHAFGYAFKISGDPKFKLLGDEIFDSTYSKRDGFYGLADFREKEYNQSYRAGGRYLAWAGNPSPVPVPSPTVSPTPVPSPTPIPSPTPVGGVTIIGAVRNHLGVVLPGSTVVMENSSGVRVTSVTAENGNYGFTNQPVGTYNFLVTAPGYIVDPITNVSITANKFIDFVGYPLPNPNPTPTPSPTPVNRIPTCRITEPLGGSTLTGNPVSGRFVVYGADVEGQLSHIELWKLSSTGIYTQEGSAKTASPAVYNFTLFPGLHTFTGRCYDAIGQMGASVPVSFTVVAAPTPTPTPTPVVVVTRIEITPTTGRISNRGSIRFTAKAYSGETLVSNATITWHNSNVSHSTLDASGVLRSISGRRTSTTVYATSGITRSNAVTITLN